MITFLQLGSLGRLGNQLFQYAALKSLSLSKGYEIKLPDVDNASWHGQKCLLSKFNLQYSKITYDDMLKIRGTYVQSDHTGKSSGKFYHESFYDIPDNTNLYGFFQNLNYFHQYENEIKKEFIIDNNIQKKCDEYLERNIYLYEDAQECVNKSDVVVIMHPDTSFKSLDFSNKKIVDNWGLIK